jgi:hypothetical protein
MQLDQLSYLASALIDELAGVEDTDGLRMQLASVRIGRSFRIPEESVRRRLGGPLPGERSS